MGKVASSPCQRKKVHKRNGVDYCQVVGLIEDLGVALRVSHS